MWQVFSAIVTHGGPSHFVHFASIEQVLSRNLFMLYDQIPLLSSESHDVETPGLM